ncbi:MAG: MarR family transcriptional regulator [Ilumatobacter sp.]|uniref:MarR family winged helix-turn-helix transcriptional regulator n=1 Tax=Ilumatobacter sp. TaxID=1967498 RepID=UPI00260CBD0B|nr:MarR family transcriptional regulator [Ilumatobacter sp.]MDJ0767467.1 MarR family transcriptional regulator [Ilumatobacter sp.]
MADSTNRRIALAWRELRRGAAGAALRSHLFGPDGPQLEQAQLDALEILVAAPDGLRMSDFAEALRVDPSTATRAVGRLEQIGLAERDAGAHDRRVVHARATAAGRRFMSRIVRRQQAGLERLLDSFEEGEREEFAVYLERFVASIDRLSKELDSRR